MHVYVVTTGNDGGYNVGDHCHGTVSLHHIVKAIGYGQIAQTVGVYRRLYL